METAWTLKEICRIVNGSLYGEEGLFISSIGIDSRNMLPSSESMFVALQGRAARRSSLTLNNCISRVSGLFWFPLDQDVENFPGAGFCLVEDTLVGLQKLAAARRKDFSGQVAAITGSNGKTIVKEWIYQLLAPSFDIHRSPKSFNSQVGVPLSVLMLEDHHQIGLFEAGISLPGEMERLERIISPDVGVFTNLGTAHQENFESLEEKLKEKLFLVQTLQQNHIQGGSKGRTFVCGSFPG